MKKSISFLFVALMAVVFIFASCDKKSDDVVSPGDQKQYVNLVAGSFIPNEGDITLKSADLTKVTRTWTMLTNNATFYTPDVWSLVDGREFIVGSAANNFWKTAGNNPASFPASTQVYSNLTPDEDLRCILETKNSSGAVVFLGMVDFNPSSASFPMKVNGFRLGDKLTINADALFNLPGGNRLVITATYKLSPVDLAATKLGTITGASVTPTGKQFEWTDVIYGADVTKVQAVGPGTVELYDGLTDKVKGIVNITVTDNGSPLTGPTGGYSVNVDLSNEPGKGHALTLTTTKIGWYDSDFITFTDTDITVNQVSVPVN